jgi:methionyl-tRNA synthetase
VDSYRYYFVREIAFGQDGSFSWESMVDRHNADLANGLGNLASRVLAMLGSSFDGAVPEDPRPAAAGDLPRITADVARRFAEHLERFELTQAIGAIWEIVARANGYLVERAPWNLAKAESPDAAEELASVLYASAETLRILAMLISPVMPGAAARLWSQLGLDETAPLGEQRLPEAATWGGLKAGTRTSRGDALFPRLDA